MVGVEPENGLQVEPGSPPAAPLVLPAFFEGSPEPDMLPRPSAPSCTSESPLVTPDRESQDDASLSPQRRSPRHDTTEDEDEPEEGM